MLLLIHSNQESEDIVYKIEEINIRLYMHNFRTLVE